MKLLLAFFVCLLVFGCIQGGLPQNNFENLEQSSGQNFSQNIVQNSETEEAVLNARIQEPLEADVSVSSEEEFLEQVDGLVEQQIAGQEN